MPCFLFFCCWLFLLVDWKVLLLVLLFFLVSSTSTVLPSLSLGKKFSNPLGTLAHHCSNHAEADDMGNRNSETFGFDLVDDHSGSSDGPLFRLSHSSTGMARTVATGGLEGRPVEMWLLEIVRLDDPTADGTRRLKCLIKRLLVADDMVNQNRIIEQKLTSGRFLWLLYYSPGEERQLPQRNVIAKKNDKDRMGSFLIVCVVNRFVRLLWNHVDAERKMVC